MIVLAASVAALCRRVRRNDLAAEEARVRCEHWLGRLLDGLFTLTPDRDLLADAAALAVELKHPLQDCLYLAEARRFDAPLITADRTFRDRVLAFDSRVSLLDGERSWRTTTTFNRDDLPLVAKVADLAHTYIFGLVQSDAQPSPEP